MTLLVLFRPSRVVAISTFTLLLYYTLANVSVLKLSIQKRLNHLFSLNDVYPLEAWIIGARGLASGVVVYWIRKRLVKE